MVIRAVTGPSRTCTAPAVFTAAYFHRLDKLAQEVRDTGLILVERVTAEGPGRRLLEFDVRCQNDRRRPQFLDALARIEREPGMLEVRAHLIDVVHRPSGPGRRGDPACNGGVAVSAGTGRSDYRWRTSR